MKQNNNNNRMRKVSKQKRRTINGSNGKNKKLRIISRNAPVSRSNRISYIDPIISSVRRSRGGVIQCRVRHKELISVIPGSVNFALQTIPVQPGISTTFPWLSAMSKNWEMYRFNNICFHYISRSATSATGTVIIAPDYDASDNAPTSYQQMSTYQNSISEVPWNSFSCTLSARSTMLVGNNRYIRFGPLSNNEDIKLYDVANLYVATVGQAGTSDIGELWVEYDIIYEVPQSVDLQTISSLSSGAYQSSNGIAVTDLLGTINDEVAGNVLITPVHNVITFTGLQPGVYYLVTYDLDATTITTDGTMTIVSGFSNGIQHNTVVATTKSMMSYSYRCINSVAVLTLGGYSVVTGGASAYLAICAYVPITTEQ